MEIKLPIEANMINFERNQKLNQISEEYLRIVSPMSIIFRML